MTIIDQIKQKNPKKTAIHVSYTKHFFMFPRQNETMLPQRKMISSTIHIKQEFVKYIDKDSKKIKASLNQ